MYRYKYNKSYYHKSKHAKRTTALAIVASVVFLGAAGYIGYDVYRQLTRKDTPVSREVFSSVQGASINLFRTEYFQFQADKAWQEVPSETKPGHFVYRAFNGPLVEHDIVIDVNSKDNEILALAKTNRVVSVDIQSNGRLGIVDASDDHCKTHLPKDTPNTPLRVTQKQVSFICSPDSVLFQAQIGVVGGSTNMPITRPDGSKATYRITYRNLKFTPDMSVLRNILDTFQAR